MPELRPNKTWRAQVKVNGDALFLGSFSSYDDAAEAERMFREGMGIRRKLTQAENDARVEQMLEQRNQGMSWKAIAADHGISHKVAREYAYRYKRRTR